MSNKLRAKPLTIALLQMHQSGNDQQANLEKALAFCQRAKRLGADIALMPEMWNIGYCFESRNGVDWTKQAVGRADPYITAFRSLAKSLSMAIAVTYLERRNGRPRNSVSLIDRHGRIVFTYAKVHTSAFHDEARCEPGDRFIVEELDTAAGPVRIGAMICFDREHPESARVLMVKGAEIVLTPNACGLDDLKIAQFRTRAFENAIGLAMANYPTWKGYNGRSIAFSAEGDRLVEAGGREGISLARFDLARLRSHRAETIWGDAFRRPSRYRELTRGTHLPIFARRDGLGRTFRADS